ncbi:GbsR/MarR family transcriptional regulator [Saccharothrix australiensis]|uniref:MarR family protein n=1 Tax=Saccharothrix australiensis TaxID=2072 RepID=A0A495W5Y5_9PSEU|nr:helix-turn-helix domain-containing protein [Saccharothrix australiensis]RKT56073.1 MarR family protein [Saccharothrix australiensis]
MPGGRLDHEDRRVIAEGLAEGLGYAEIARRLARPTSTVSREVARNGGPRDYRANRAHQATARRARRRPGRVAGSAATGQAADRSGRAFEAVREFERMFARMMVQTGLPPMMARVLACLFTSDTGSLTAAELVRRLQVSPASVSKAVKYLEPLEMVKREREPGGRRERYAIDEDVWYRAWLASTRSMAMWAATAGRGADVLGRTTPAGARLHTTSRFFRHIGQDMAKAAEHWRQALTGRP